MMSSSTAAAMPPLTENKLEKKPIKFSNLLLGAGLNLFEVTVRCTPFPPRIGPRLDQLALDGGSCCDACWLDSLLTPENLG